MEAYDASCDNLTKHGKEKESIKAWGIFWVNENEYDMGNKGIREQQVSAASHQTLTTLHVFAQSIS